MRIAFRSPAAALLINCFVTAVLREIFLGLPFSVTGMRVLSSSWNSVAKLLATFGRPLGLPDCPFVNCECLCGLGGSISPSWIAMLRSLRRVRFGRRGTGLARAYFVGSGGKRRLIVSALINILKTLVGLSQHRLLAAEAFPSADRHVAIVWIDFDHASPPARPLCRDERRTRAAKRIEDQITSLGHIADGVCDHRYRLDRRVHGEFRLATRTERVI